MTQILDSGAKINGAAAKAAGYVGVARYLSAYTPKAITKAELTADLAAGLSVVLVYEDGAQDGLGGGPVGKQHGLVARAQIDALGITGVPVVYVAIDFDAQPAQYPTLAAFVTGFGIAAGCTAAPYGPAGFVDWYLGQHGGFGWQSAGWVHGNPTEAQIVQLVQQATIDGVTCDVNNIRATDFGQWPRPNKGVAIVLNWKLSGNVADLKKDEKSGVIYLLATDGGIFPAPFGSCADRKFFVGRTAAALSLIADTSGNLVGYEVTDTAGETYYLPSTAA